MAIQWLTLVGEVLGKVIPTVVDLVKEAIEGGKKTAEELRNAPITVSIAFGGGEGEAIKIQRTIEANLPDPAPAPPAGSADPPPG